MQFLNNVFCATDGKYSFSKQSICYSHWGELFPTNLAGIIPIPCNQFHRRYEKTAKDY